MAEMVERHMQLRSRIVEGMLAAPNQKPVVEWLRNLDNWCESHAIADDSVARFMIKNGYSDAYPLLMKWIVWKDSTSPFGEWFFFFEKLFYYLRDQFPLPQHEASNYRIASHGLEIALSRFEITDELEEVLHVLFYVSVYNLRNTPKEYVEGLTDELALQKRVWKSRVQPGSPRLKRSLPDPTPAIPDGVKRSRTRKQRKEFEYY